MSRTIPDLRAASRAANHAGFPHDGGSPGRYGTLWNVIVLATVVLGALPLVIGQPAGLQDWPNHVARVSILDEILRGNTFWSARYALHPWLLTNSALDFGIEAIHRLGLTVPDAATVFLVATYACFVAGTAFLARSFPRAEPGPLTPLAATLIFFTGPIMLGLVNYVLGLAVALFGWAFWLRAQGRTGRRVCVGALTVFIACACHVAAACAFVLVLGLLKLGESSSKRLFRALFSAETIAPAAVLLAMMLHVAVSGHADASAGASQIAYAGGSALPSLLMGQASSIGHMLVDGIGLHGLVASVLGLLVFGTCSLFGAKLSMSRVAAVAVIGMLVTALLLPDRLGLAGRIGYRVALVPLILAAAGTQFRWRNGHWRSASLGALVVLCLARTGSLTEAAMRSNDVYRTFEADAAAMPPGSMLVTVLGRSFDHIPWSEFWSPPLEELGSAAVARSVFVTSIFAFQSQQPLVLDPKYNAIRRPFAVETAAALERLRDDLRPFCRSGEQGEAGAPVDVLPVYVLPVYVLIVYPGPLVDKAIDARAVVAHRPGYRLVDWCKAVRPGAI